jgi:hypothetical protein
MRFVSFLLLASTLVFSAGCGSTDAMPARMRDRFNPPEPKVQVFEADQKAVFEAAQVALKQMDFQISRAGLAQGIINSHSRIQPGDSFGKARQYVMEVRLHSYDPGKTEVAVSLREQEESTSFAGATDIPVREHGLYSSFFEGLSQALKSK